MTKFSKGIRVPAKLYDLRALVDSLEGVDGEATVRIETHHAVGLFNTITKHDVYVDYEEKHDEPLNEGGHINVTLNHKPGEGGDDAWTRAQELMASDDLEKELKFRKQRGI